MKRHELLITKVIFLNRAEAASREELFDVIGNNPDGELMFKKDKTMWFEGNEYKVMNVSFKIDNHTQSEGTNCEVVIEIERI